MFNDIHILLIFLYHRIYYYRLILYYIDAKVIKIIQLDIIYGINLQNVYSHRNMNR